MAARAVPTMPDWTAGQRVLASQLQQATTYARFWTSPPSFHMYQSITQSVATSTITQALFDVSDYDTDSGRAVSTPWSYTIPSGMTGRWGFDWKIAWATSGTGFRLSALYKNAVQVARTQATHLGPAGVNDEVGSAHIEIACNAGDVMIIQIDQTSGSPLSTEVTGPSYFEGRLISLANP